ncbi:MULTISPECIES: glutamine amidotransferase [unclassified Curtobacterium]|uniref:glutamine amidotransferase n=1 Tax=unclassified Curtobacterium TaxID=257496 RepID=UPI000DA89D3B|nr:MULTISPECIES: glutamine amidotransferase [unclassified Curtobacterium]PZE26064.1 cytoplasmic protein [Curtobacterium sp. MCBD17_028]PZE77732.1 cytoplasmic protein [Curtobacterium sp. MCBD17_019]PZF62059.1 cytoplasmic protein [Curtobacterium sp. MCBD17_034]PZM34008.1 cytoplasmic protein [Curtobacterium sp. MCBD17_031]WIE54703.1 glutamine amidotransferase [Curtobacterium sp. MCBD17_003]
MSRILIAGESWMSTTTHTKGVDEFTVHSYTEGVRQLKTALESGGHDVVHLPAHLVPTDFPGDAESLGAYDVVILSDIGANSLQLAPGVFEHAVPGQDRLEALSSWVEAGGSILMIGGYLSFSGFQARAAFAETVLTRVLPVDLLTTDDRVEQPAGVVPTVLAPDHAALGGAGSEWPSLLGYNRVTAKAGTETLARVGDDPLLVVGEVGAGRSAAFTSDCSPHWAPPAFCEEWAGYTALFNGVVGWLVAR